jgi:alkylhydroperoxidase family enzyme
LTAAVAVAYDPAVDHQGDVRDDGKLDATPPPPPAPPVPLPRHRYPAVFLVAAAAVVAAAVFSAVHELPGLVRATDDVRAGRAALDARQVDVAVARFTAAHADDPSSKKAVLGYAEALFVDTSHADDRDALDALVGVSLSKSDWSELTAYMPSEYQSFFGQTGS